MKLLQIYAKHLSCTKSPVFHGYSRTLPGKQLFCVTLLVPLWKKFL